MVVKGSRWNKGVIWGKPVEVSMDEVYCWNLRKKVSQRQLSLDTYPAQ